MGNYLVANPSLYLFIACTEVNAYLVMLYFFKTDDKFINSRRKIG